MEDQTTLKPSIRNCLNGIEEVSDLLLSHSDQELLTSAFKEEDKLILVSKHIERNLLIDPIIKIYLLNLQKSFILNPGLKIKLNF